MEHYALAAELNKFWNMSPPLILVENNARLAAWGEKCNGLASESRDFIVLSIHGAGERGSTRTEIGLGSGIVLDGRLFTGKNGGAGELDRFFTKWLLTHYPEGSIPSSLTEMGEEQLRDFAADLGSNFSHIINYLAPEKLLVNFNEEPPSPLFVKWLREAIHANLQPPGDQDFPVEMSLRGVESLLDGGIHRLRQLYFAPSNHLLQQVQQALKRR
jgi:predicted NBD/HSP70 family sugar kinase